MTDDDAGGFTGEYAAFYDVQRGRDDRPDVEFYVDRARDADGQVLELACGTGRVTLPLLRTGVDVDGFDLSGDALDVLRERARDQGLEPTVWADDMADFAVDREYALAICPFNALQHMTTVEDQLACLASVHDALAPGGAFVFDVFVPGFDVICETYGEWRVEETEFRGDPVEFRTRSTIADEVAQTFRVENEVRDEAGDLAFESSFELAMLPARTVELLARLSPFSAWSVAGDFADRPLSDGDSVQVWTLEK